LTPHSNGLWASTWWETGPRRLMLYKNTQENKIEDRCPQSDIFLAK
jgi:hypothetical protein